MQTWRTISRILAITGTVLCWITIAIAIGLSIGLLVSTGKAAFDYLIPAELYYIALPGGALVLVAALLAARRRVAAGVTLVVAVAGLVGGQATAVATGIASGAAPAAGWPWIAANALIIVYIAALVLLGAIGIALARDQRRSASHTSP
ncbi:hypothetical protein BH11ACT4_BH11ACT4_01360 [soil metagenome]